MVCCLRLLRAIKSLAVKEPLLQECRKGYSLEKKFCTGQGVQEKKFAFNCILHSPRNPALSFHYRRQPVFFVNHTCTTFFWDTLYSCLSCSLTNLHFKFWQLGIAMMAIHSFLRSHISNSLFWHRPPLLRRRETCVRDRKITLSPFLMCWYEWKIKETVFST